MVKDRKVWVKRVFLSQCRVQLCVHHFRVEHNEKRQQQTRDKEGASLENQVVSPFFVFFIHNIAGQPLISHFFFIVTPNLYFLSLELFVFIRKCHSVSETLSKNKQVSYVRGH